MPSASSTICVGTGLADHQPPTTASCLLEPKALLRPKLIRTCDLENLAVVQAACPSRRFASGECYSLQTPENRFASVVACQNYRFGHDNDRPMTAEGSDDLGDVHKMFGQF